MIPEALLPKRPHDTKAPHRPLGQILELSDESWNVTSRRHADHKMNVIGHDAISVHRDRPLRSKARQNPTRGRGGGGVAKNRFATASADGEGVDSARHPISGRR